ncbi:MAG: efflux RND transporter periplasmic adaptor subunit [Rikenellaceae bacterium]
MKFTAILALVLLASSCANRPQQESMVRKVRVMSVGKVDSREVSLYPGKVVAAADVNLAFRVAGVVERVVACEGDFVREGDVLAYLDRRDYATQLAATEAEYDGVKSEVDRVVELYKSESTSANNHDKAVTGLRAISAKLEAHRAALADTELKAPFDGYIQRVNFNRGETLAAGMPIISMISSSEPEVEIYISAEDYLKRTDLLAAKAKVESLAGESFELESLGTTHKANLNQLYKSRFRVKSKGATSPTPGMSTMVELSYKSNKKSTISIPISAVVRFYGKSMVWLFDDGKAKIREVEIAEITSGGRAIIKSGLSGGETIITAGLARLHESQSVEPLEEATESNVGNIL